MGKGNGAWCAVAGCNNSRRNTEGISFHRFPKDSKLKKVWILKCYRDDKFKADNRLCTICSTHFKEEDFERDLKAELLNLKPRQILKEGSIPSQNLPMKDLPRKSKKIIKRNERIMARETKQNQEEIISSILLLSSSSEVQDSSIFLKMKPFAKSGVLQYAEKTSNQPDDFKPLTFGRARLKKDCVPSLFDFPKNFGADIKSRKSPLPRNDTVPESNDSPETSAAHTSQSKAPPTSKRQLYMGDFSEYLTSPRKAEKLIKLCNEIIRNMRKRNKRLIEKVQDMQALVDFLKEEKLVEEPSSKTVKAEFPEGVKELFEKTFC